MQVSDRKRRRMSSHDMHKLRPLMVLGMWIFKRTRKLPLWIYSHFLLSPNRNLPRYQTQQLGEIWIIFVDVFGYSFGTWSSCHRLNLLLFIRTCRINNRIGEEYSKLHKSYKFANILDFLWFCWFACFECDFVGYCCCFGCSSFDIYIHLVDNPDFVNFSYMVPQITKNKNQS